MITHRIKNIALLVMAILLLISGTLNFIQVRNAKQDQLNAMLRNEQANTMIAAQTARADMLDSLAKAKERSAKERATKDSVALKVKERAISVMSRNLAVLRVPVQPLIDSLQNLGLFVETYDSLSAQKDSLIYDMGLRHAAQIVDLEEVLSLTRAQINELVDISNQLQNQLVESQTQTRKEKRKKKFFRTLSVISLGAVGVLLLKPN